MGKPTLPLDGSMATRLLPVIDVDVLGSTAYSFRVKGSKLIAFAGTFSS
jgi:hypothetical protein